MWASFWRPKPGTGFISPSVCAPPPFERPASAPFLPMPKLCTDAQLLRALNAPPRPVYSPDDPDWPGTQANWVATWGGRLPPAGSRKAWWKQECKQHGELVVKARAKLGGLSAATANVTTAVSEAAQPPSNFTAHDAATPALGDGNAEAQPSVLGCVAAQPPVPSDSCGGETPTLNGLSGTRSPSNDELPCGTQEPGAASGTQHGYELRKRLKVSDKWVARHAPSIANLRAPTPRLTPSGAHATRVLHATVETPGGHEREYSEAVRESLPPPGGERASEAQRRDNRARRRQQLAIERLGASYERELATEQKAAEAAAAAERAAAAAAAEEAAREKRKLLVVRDGYTLYDGISYRRIDPSKIGLRSVAPVVFYPDGYSCAVRTDADYFSPVGRVNVMGPGAVARLVVPWTASPDLPPAVCSWATLGELKQIRIAAASLSSWCLMAESAPWRDLHLQRQQCPQHVGCTTFMPRGFYSHEKLARIKMEWASGAWRPLHIRLGGPDPEPVHGEVRLEEWRLSCKRWQDQPVQRADRDAPACGAVAVPAFLAALANGSAAVAEPPSGRVATPFTAIAAAAGLSARLQYLQVGDMVLYRGERRVALMIDKYEILFQVPRYDQGGERCSLERAVYAIQELGTSQSMPPPPPRMPPPPPVAPSVAAPEPLPSEPEPLPSESTAKAHCDGKFAHLAEPALSAAIKEEAERELNLMRDCARACAGMPYDATVHGPIEGWL